MRQPSSVRTCHQLISQTIATPKTPVAITVNANPHEGPAGQPIDSLFIPDTYNIQRELWHGRWEQHLPHAFWTGITDQFATGYQEMDKPTLRLRKNGPIVVTGDIELVDSDGNPILMPVDKGNVALCRCGLSSSKPFCDGSHHRLGWSEGSVPPKVD